MPTQLSLRERDKAYYSFDFSNNLPPGTDTPDQLDKHQRQPRPPAKPTRPVPEWPPESERKGKWISSYLDKLDPKTEYDQIIKTATFFTGNSFAIALGYCSTFVMLSMPPGGAAAVHFGARAFKQPHRRFYETQDKFLDWLWYGSSSEETIQGIESVNKLHASIWKNVPGVFSNPLEGQMSVIGSAVAEIYLRKLVGAKNQELHPHVAAAWPEWAERTLAHFRTEPSDGGRSYGVNFPRNWDELEAFYSWFQQLPFEQWTNEEERAKGRRIAQAFVEQFSTLWFPKQMKWLGRQMLLTVLHPRVREQQQLGHPNPLVAGLIKFGLKVQFDIADVMPDPTHPSLHDEHQAIKGWEWGKIDQIVSQERTRKGRITDFILVAILLLCFAALVAYQLKSRW